MDPVIERFVIENGTDPVPFSKYMAFALYDEEIGFYTGSSHERVGRAGGRGGDFLTSPEVGPLFGALVTERLDREWDALGNPDTFAVVECGAGPGTLARSIAIAAPRCSAALRYVMVEISDAQRALHGSHLDGWVGEVDEHQLGEFLVSDGMGPRFASSPTMPGSITGVVLANELLDNLPFGIVRHDGGGAVEMLAVAVGTSGDELEFVTQPIVLAPEELAVIATAPVGEWLPLQRRAREWVRAAIDGIDRGALIVVDYAGTTAELAKRPAMGWLRTFAANERGGHPLDAPGTLDITADVAIDQVSIDHTPTKSATQRDWLADLGIEALVDEGRQIWNERVAAPDLIALRARSRAREAEALSDPDGLGGFRVLEWERR